MPAHSNSNYSLLPLPLYNTPSSPPSAPQLSGSHHPPSLTQGNNPGWLRKIGDFHVQTLPIVLHMLGITSCLLFLSILYVIVTGHGKNLAPLLPWVGSESA